MPHTENAFQVLQDPVEKQGFTGTVQNDPPPVFVPDFGGLIPSAPDPLVLPQNDVPPIMIQPPQIANDAPTPADVGCLTGCGPAFTGKAALPLAVPVVAPVSNVSVGGLNANVGDPKPVVMAGPFSPFFSMMVAGLPLWLWILLAAVLVFNGRD